MYLICRDVLLVYMYGHHKELRRGYQTTGHTDCESTCVLGTEPKSELQVLLTVNPSLYCPYVNYYKDKERKTITNISLTIYIKRINLNLVI